MLMAAHNGHVEIIGELLQVSPMAKDMLFVAAQEMGFVRGFDRETEIGFEMFFTRF